MKETASSCIRVSDTLQCLYCKELSIIKNGKTKTGKQQFRCKSCNKRFIDFYSYKAYHAHIDDHIVILTKEGLGIRSTARVLRISTTTLLKRILLVAKNIKPPIIAKGKTYEVDEIRSFIKRKDKLIWIVYALERETKEVVSFNIGARTNKTLNTVLQTLHLSEAKKIHTDKLPNYSFLIEQEFHCNYPYCTNHIERKNLSLRTHLKRLNRRSICFSRSKAILWACLCIYFWA